MSAFLHAKGRSLRVLFSIFFATLFSLAEAQQITALSPRTVLVGQSVELEIIGKNLGISGDGNLELLTSFSCEYEVIGEDPKPPEDNKEGKPRNKVRMKVSLKGNPGIGIGWLRLVTSRGITPPVLVLVDDLPTQKVPAKTRREEAALLDLPVAIDSRTPNLDHHYYKLAVKAGQRIAIEVVGSRLGEDVDAVMKLLDANGRILATSDDEPGSGKDPRLAHVFKEETTAYIEVREVSYKGGKFYRLRVGNFPLPISAFPMVAQAGTQTSFAAISSSGKTILQQSTHLPPLDGTSSSHSLGFKGKEHNASGFVPIRLAAEPLVLEKEPNNQTSEAQVIKSSVTLNGRLQKPEDVDIYAFDVQKGQHLHFSPFCRSMGAPTFLMLSLQDEKGRVLASAGEGNSAEESLQHRASADGRLYLIVKELAGRGSPAFTYAISAHLEATPLRFQWESGKSSPLSISGQPGSAVTVKLKSIRRNFAETIELTPVSDSTEWEVFGSTSIGKDKGNFDFEIQIPNNRKPGDWDSLHLRASFQKEGQPQQDWTDVLYLKPAFQNLLPTIPFPPPEWLNHIPLFVIPRKIELTMEPLSGKPGEVVEIKAAFNKSDKSFRFAKPKTSWHGFPKEWKVPPKAQDLNESDGFSVLKVTIPKNAVPGENIEIYASVRGELEGTHFMRVFSNKVSLKVTDDEEVLED